MKKKTVTSNLEDVSFMLKDCSSLQQFTCDLPDFNMFGEPQQLEEDLSNLADGDNMFKNCNKLLQFISVLPKLDNSFSMMMLFIVYYTLIFILLI
jgi:hypothetical protein